MAKLTMAEVGFYLQEAKSCEDRQRTELLQRNNYPFLINYFEGVEKVGAIGANVSAANQYAIINEYFPSTNRLISEIMYQNPDILLEALKPQAEEDLPVMKAALKHLFNKAEGLIENRVALFDMFFAGYCAVEIDHIADDRGGYGLPMGSLGERNPAGGLIEKVKNFIGMGEVKDEEEAEKKLEGDLPEVEENYSAERTYIRRYNPLDVPLDWRAERVKDRRYNLKKVWMSKAEFCNKYKKFENRVQPESKGWDYSQHDNLLHSGKVLLYEFQIRNKNNKYVTIIISPTVTNEEIDYFERPYVTNGFNMKIGTLHKYGKLYPISYAQINKKMQDEMNGYVRFMMEVAERNIPKRVADKNKVKVDGLEALNSARVNDTVMVDGNAAGAIYPLPQTNISVENQTLLGIFRDQKTKLWNVSESKLGLKSDAKFMGEIEIQEQGFQSTQIDIQEGLRFLIQEELDTGKDIIVNFWDNAVFLKVTGHPKMGWYEPVMITDPNNPDRQIVSNPLTDLLTGDYEVKVDIVSAFRPNRQQELQRMSAFMTQLIALRPILNAQMKDINVEEIQRISKEFGWNPDKLLIDMQPPQIPMVGGGAPGKEQLTPEEDARRQAEAERRAAGGGKVA